MTGTSPEPGLVISYAYLWHYEAVEGHEEGYKERPCLIVSAEPQPGGFRRVLVLPITHAPPATSVLVQEIPAAIRRHLKLDDARCWIVLSEANEFQWPGPDLGHSGPDSGLIYERAPPRFFETVRRRFISNAVAGETTSVKRTDV